METKDFSKMLVEAREKAGVSRYALALKMGVVENVLRRIELAFNNYNLKKIFEYLHAINCGIVLSNGKEEVRFENELECIDWIRKMPITKSLLSQLSNISRMTLINIENKKTTARIDTFLKIVEALGYKVEKIC